MFYVLMISMYKQDLFILAEVKIITRQKIIENQVL